MATIDNDGQEVAGDILKAVIEECEQQTKTTTCACIIEKAKSMKEAL